MFLLLETNLQLISLFAFYLVRNKSNISMTFEKEFLWKTYMFFDWETDLASEEFDDLIDFRIEFRLSIFLSSDFVIV